jgi:hypothetical protein
MGWPTGYPSRNIVISNAPMAFLASKKAINSKAPPRRLPAYAAD